MTIHHTDPFATPDGQRSPVRRLRGRLPAAVTLWTAPGPAGLTVSSTMIADGDPGRVLGLIDEESDLWAAVEAGGVFAVTVLAAADRQLADRFAGLLPAPGGLFAGSGWLQTRYGPVPTQPRTWAGCRLVGARPLGWALLLEAVLEEIDLAATGPAGADPAATGPAGADPAATGPAGVGPADEGPRQAENGPLVHLRGRYATLR